MSRIGKIAIPVPSDVKVFVEPMCVRLEGPKGKLILNLPENIQVQLKDHSLLVNRISDLKQDRANHGTVRAILAHMIIGVTKGHKKELEIQGVGFKAQLQGNRLILNLGLSHPLEYFIPKDIKVTVPQPTLVNVEGTDKALVGQVAAQIRDFKRAEPYKGKGVRYVGEVVRRKQGKSVTK